MLAVVEPRCGERVRRLLRRLCPAPPGKPLPVARQKWPVFPVCSKAVPELSALKCYVELVGGACRVRHRAKPPLSYVIVGGVAIVSLDERLQGREQEVAEELLKTVPGLRAVYGKVETRGRYRVQQLRHLAGERVEEVIHVENGLRFPVPLGKVYINPRLAAEHMRIAVSTKPGENVLDMFSGIGGFAVTIAAYGRASLIVANDLNPYAARAAARAVLLNRARLRAPVLVLNRDATILPEMLKPVFHRVIMNLPHGSKRFLCTGLRLCNPAGCLVHLYTVARSPEEAVSGLLVAGTLRGVTRVLDYAPGKYIFRVDVEYDEEGIAACKRRR